MIFLFFGTSLALLEAELAPFKDWEDIGTPRLCSSARPGLGWLGALQQGASTQVGMRGCE